jgi:hypothetical protein
VAWDEGFSERYDDWSANMTEDVPFYVELARQADGRVAIPAAQARTGT